MQISHCPCFVEYISLRCSIFALTGSFSFFPLSLTVSGYLSSCKHWQNNRLWKVSVPFLFFFGLMPECIIVVNFCYLGFHLIESYFFVWCNEMKTYMLEYNRLYLELSRSCFCRIPWFCNTTSYRDFKIFIMNLMHFYLLHLLDSF